MSRFSQNDSSSKRRHPLEIAGLAAFATLFASAMTAAHFAAMWFAPPL